MLPVVSILPVLLHHSEPADPTLLHWIREQIDAILGLGPAAIVLTLGALIAAFPIALGVWVLMQHRRDGRSA